jgi:hypothetical protein
MNNKRIISVLLIAVLIFSIIPVQQLFAALSTQAEFDAYVLSNGFPLENSASKPANFQTYQRWGLIVYGNYLKDDMQYSPVTNKEEPRYLGYDRYNNLYTNTLYPNDDRGTKTLLQWTYENVDGATASWNGVQDDDQKNFMQNTNLGFLAIDGLTVLPYSGLTVNGKITTPKARLQNPASFRNGFSVYTLHKGDNGKLYYATLYGPAMGNNTSLSCVVNTTATTYYIRAGETSVTIPVTATATANLVGQYVKARHIKNINVNFMGKNNPLSGVTISSLPKAGESLNVVYTRSELGVGTHNKTLEASATMQSTFEDAYTATANKPITIIVEPEGDKPSAIATIDAEESKQFTGTDIPVTVTMTGKINNITDISKIEKVQFLMRIMPDGPGDQEQTIPVPVALNVSTSHTFYVPASKLNGVENYDQYFEGRVLFFLKDGTSIEDRSIWGPPLSAPTVKDYTRIYKAKPPVQDSNIPPVAIITGDDTAVVGSSIYISGLKSYDPDGTIEEYTWYFRDADIERPNKLEDEGKASGSVTYRFTGRKQVILGVTDNKGAYSETEHFITVTPPYPIPIIHQAGALKVNRKVTIDATPSYSHPAYPINHSLTSWIITPVTAGITAADIKYSGTLTGIKKDFLVKKPGQYKVGLTVTNSAGMSSTTYQIINIVPDKPPIADFTVVKQQLRDPNNYNQAQIILVDQSYCIDGDYIDKRNWKYAYDSNNNGLFTDETWRVLDNENNTIPELFVYDVGKYAFELEVEEVFGQPTIPEFVTPSDILKGNTLSKLAADKVVDVINVAPIADISSNKTKNIDLVVISDYAGDKLTELRTKLNQYVSDSFSNRLNVKLNIFNGSKYLGRYIPEDSGGFSLVNDESTPKYTVANWNGLIEYSDNTYTVSFTTQRVFPSDTTTVTNGVFPANIVKSVQYNSGKATLWLLENGDLYFMGTNSLNNSGFYSSIGIFTTKPTKIMSNVKQITGGDNLYYILTNAGDVYAIGHTLYYYWQPQNWFYTAFNQYDLRTVIPYSGYDEYGALGYSYNTFTGYGGVVKVVGLNNISYIWSSGTALVARNSNGKWYGFGRGLNAFGLCTGFENTPPPRNAEYLYGSFLKATSYMNDNYYLDNTNSIVELTNLSSLDSTIGGIEKVSPNTVYAKNGNTYSIQETPTILIGIANYGSASEIPQDGRYYDVIQGGIGWIQIYYPFQIRNSTFSYNKTGTWTRGVTQYAATYDYPPYSVAQVDASGVSIDSYLGLLDIPRTGQKVMHTSRTDTGPPFKPSTIHTKIMQIPIRSGITDYNTFAYVLDYTYSHKVYDATLEFTDGRGEERETVYGGYKYYYNYTMHSKVLPFVRNMQAGHKVYGVNVDDLPSMSFRSNTEKYVLYLGEQDSFQKISKDITTFILNNNVNVRVSTKSSYIDAVVDTTKYINLRQFATVTPKGAIYGEYQIDQILQDITNENLVTQTDNKLYVLKDEDTVEYLKYFYDYENDIIQSERLKYDHDPNYFENSLGLTTYSGQWLTELIYTFDKVGKYVLTYQAQDNPKNNPLFTNYWLWSKGTNQLEIYVHRRPIADFVVFSGETHATYKNLIIKNQAHDLDHQTQANKGIIQTEWKWKLETETAWRNGLPSIIENGKPIYIWQRVFDEERVWSYPTLKYLKFEDIKSPPVAQFTITKNPILEDELLKLRDTSYTNEGTLIRWHWIVEKLSDHSIVHNAQFANSNAGTGDLAGFDSNVKTDYESLGPGSYKIYLRVKNSNNLWSDAGTDAAYDLNSFYSQTLVVNESLKLFDFRVSIIRDLQLANYYKSPTTGKYLDKPIYVNNMAIDGSNFGIAGLTKGYMFEFQIDSINFNGSADTIEIEPRYYTTDLFTRDMPERDLYWEDSNHKIWRVGQGGHASWDKIILNALNRTIKSSNLAIWRGEYFIPGTAWAVPRGTSASNAKTAVLKRDIIVNFQVKGYKAGVLKYDYNIRQWPLERTYTKRPYLIGDVIKYDYSKSNLDDIKFKDNR